MAAARFGVECSGVRDRGPAPARREDQFLVAELGRSILVQETSLPQADHSRIVGRSQGMLLVVATGRGASGAGAVAGTVAVEGLTRHVTGPAIADELAVPAPLGRGAEIGRRLVARARGAGASGDVTVVLARMRAAKERRRLPRSRS